MPKFIPCTETEARLDQFCHPSNAVRTRCECGRVISLGKSGKLGPPTVVCECGKKHRKAMGGWKGGNNGGQREGGNCGCLGI